MTPPDNADPVRDLADRLADYMITRNVPWRSADVMREAVYETCRLLFGEARFETKRLLAEQSDGEDRS